VIWHIANLAEIIQSKITKCPRKQNRWGCRGVDCYDRCPKRQKLEQAQARREFFDEADPDQFMYANQLSNDEGEK
jgi:hypothetical protein